MLIQVEKTDIQSFEKAILENIQLAKKFLGAFKKLLSNFSLFSDSAKSTFIQITKDYLLVK